MCGNACHLLDRMVPRNHAPFFIDGKRGIRKEIDDIGKPPFRFTEEAFSLFPPGSLPDLVPQLGELGLRITTFLDIEIGSVINGLDHDFLTAPAGKEDERDISETLPHSL